MTKPIVAIVGRPNVGKSTFFNRVLGGRQSIVQDVPGVTRDRIYADARWLETDFTLVDTGGLEMRSEDIIKSQMRTQAQLAAETADLILFFVDGREGLTAEDSYVADYLRRVNKPVLLVVNKLDNAAREDAMYEFYELGMGDPYAVSSAHGLGTGDLLDAVVRIIGAQPPAPPQEDVLRIAVVGKPNAGKSSLVNYILGQERTIVSPIPGTTRDAVDTPFERDGKRYVIIDTAGIRRKARIEPNTLERFSVVRSLAAVRRCDVVVLLIDAVDGVSDQDAKIASFVQESGKPAILAVNKWDAVDKDTGTVGRYVNDLRTQLVFMQYAPILFISCKSGQRVHKVLPECVAVRERSNLRVSTGLLNDVIRDAVAAYEPPATAGRRLRILYATQAEVAPPHFILFCNDAKLMRDPYLRYLENHMRKTFDFTGTPLRITCRSRSEKGE